MTVQNMSMLTLSLIVPEVLTVMVATLCPSAAADMYVCMLQISVKIVPMSEKQLAKHGSILKANVFICASMHALTSESLATVSDSGL